MWPLFFFEEIMWPLFGPNSAWWLILLWSHFLSHQKFRLLKCGVHEAMCRFFSPLRTHLYFFFSLSWHQVSAGNLEVSHTYTYQFCNRNDANWSNPVQLTRERLLHFVEKVQLLCAKKMAALVTTIDYANIEILKDTFLGIDIGIPWHICFYLLFNVSLLLIAVGPVWFLCIAWFLVGNWLTKECSSLTNVVCKNGM